MKANYHTHTYFCGHADGDASDYAEVAYKNNFQVLGISDHAPNQNINDYHVRMDMNQLESYIKDIEKAQNTYKDKLIIYKGLEVEYFQNQEDYYKLLKNNVDYLIHGQHYITYQEGLTNLKSGFALSTESDLERYKELMIQAIRSKLFDIHAHPDLFMNGYRNWDDHANRISHEICKAAQEENAIFEYNANGYRRGIVDTNLGKQPTYPRREFWNIVKQYKIRTILSSDCHTPNFLYDSVIKRAEEDYKSLELPDVGILHFKK